MASIFDKLVGKGLIKDYPPFIKNNIHYEAMVGSISYGVSGDTSDIDVVGFCLPPKHIIFPHKYGYIHDFGEKPQSFGQYQQHHIKDVHSDKDYDVTIYNIVRFFDKCMGANPNMIDSLFVPTRCVLHISMMGEMVRENRKIFLSGKCFHKFKGYAFSQLTKMKDKIGREFVMVCDHYGWPLDITREDAMKDVHGYKDITYISDIFNRIDQSGKRSKRLPSIKKYGYDVKFAYNVVRLLEECHQILEEGDLDLTRSRAMLKSIRNGEWEMKRVEEFFDHKFKLLEVAYSKTKLPSKPREDDIKNLLLQCIDSHYEGSVSNRGQVDKVAHDLLCNILSDAGKLAGLIGSK